MKLEALDISGPDRLLSRRMHDDYEKCTFSFEFGYRDRPIDLTMNDWDLQFGNGSNGFLVNMVTDDRSRIVDLGSMEWGEVNLKAIPYLQPMPEVSFVEEVPAAISHIYLVHTVDSNSNLTALFRVDDMVAGDWVDITWSLIEPASWKSVPSRP